MLTVLANFVRNMCELEKILILALFSFVLLNYLFILKKLIKL